MVDRPSYAIVGKGRWGTRVRAMLEADGRRCVVVEQIRRRAGEPVDDYAKRMSEELRLARADLAWLAVSPGGHVPVLVRAALEAGLDVIVEKPWPYSPEESDAVLAAQRSASRLVAVDYEYCLLEAVGQWQARYRDTAGLVFGGSFVLGRENVQGIPAMDNLGTHLLAIREYAVPRAAVGEIRCGYLGPPERRVWLDGPEGRVAELDFSDHGEPIVQRFVAAVEQARGGGEIAFDIPFAQRVAMRVAQEIRRSPA